MNHHSIASELVDKLLPNGAQSSQTISKPRWKAIESRSNEILRSEYDEMVEFVSTTYIESVTACFSDWETVLKHLACFGSIEKLAEKCASFAASMSEDELFLLCSKIARRISHTRTYYYGNDIRMHQSDVLERLLFSLLPDKARSYAIFFLDNFNGLTPCRYIEDKYDYEQEARMPSSVP